MRKTELAEQQFKFAQNRTLEFDNEAGTDSSSKQACAFNTINGLQHLAQAIRDLFDKLGEIEKKVDALIYSAARK